MVEGELRIDRLLMEMELIKSSLKIYVYWLVWISFLLYFLHKMTGLVFAPGGRDHFSPCKSFPTGNRSSHEIQSFRKLNEGRLPADRYMIFSRRSEERTEKL